MARRLAVPADPRFVQLSLLDLLIKEPAPKKQRSRMFNTDWEKSKTQGPTAQNGLESRVLTAALSPKYSQVLDFVQAIALDLNLQTYTVKKTIQRLRRHGFDIPTREQRAVARSQVHSIGGEK